MQFESDGDIQNYDGFNNNLNLILENYLNFFDVGFFFLLYLCFMA